MADFEDLFTGTLDTNLTDHTPDVGTAWTGGGSTLDNARLNGNGELKAESNEALHAIWSDDLGSPDHQIWFKLFGNNAALNARACVRVAGTDNYGGGAARDANGDINFTSRSGGSTNGHGSINVATDLLVAEDDPVWIRIKAEGDTITWWTATGTEPTNPEDDTNWTLQVTATVTTANTEQKPGLVLWGTSFTDSDGDPLIDEYHASALTGGGGDTTAPTLTNALASATGDTTADGSVDTDEANGTLYWVVSTSATAPSVAQIQAGQDSTGAAAAAAGNQAVSATGTQNVSASGLTASTTYYFHFQHQDAAANDSTVVSSASFTTQATDTTAPTLSSATVDGTALALTYNETLDAASVPAAGDFTVTGSISGAITVSAVGISGADVNLTLASAVAGGETVTLDYTPGVNPIQDTAGNDAGSLTGQAVTNNTVVKGVSVTLYDRATQSVRASVTGIVARWWDSPTDTGAPLFETTTEETDASGVLVIDLDAVTNLAVGSNGYLVLYKQQADPQSDWHFAARVPVSDIS